ncbi:hypothetical protein N1027_18180 [Herbiconiux sp. CPCC 205763]|uniref:Uncharacterized protein n=1 Tax=Herbiconiux aconitum TaxID=2970913 RepID=A0ABT2GV66_9MICO|nr:hypothetical protein [Herbiconiux aconitum]MCS5720063.1 hypothetical protein [Herbiconiux aconitum]
MRSTSAAAVLASLVAVVLTGCAESSSPSSPASTATAGATTGPGAGTPAPFASDEPAHPLTAVTTLVIRPDQLELAGASGDLLAEFSYDDDVVSVVEALAVVFGGQPEEVPFEGSLETHPGVEYRWDGFSVVDDERPANPADGQGHEFSVVATAPAVADDVSVTTAPGFVVGQDLGTVLESEGTVIGAFPYEVAVEFGASRGPDEPAFEAPNAYAVVLYSDESLGSVLRVVAPINMGMARV